MPVATSLDISISWGSLRCLPGDGNYGNNTVCLSEDGNYGGGGVTPLRAPTPLCQNRVCLTRGVSPGAYRGAQGRSLKNTWKMFVFNCMIHFVTCIVTIFPITELLGYP